MEGKNILIIDDSNTNLVLLESLLERSGFSVVSALSAKEGMEALRESRPDLIYLDLLMPEIDGIEFIRLVKENEDWKNIPIVILSAVTDVEVIKQSRDIGAIDYITKPLDIDKIISLTREILKN